ncbi:MAG: 50S ribosomal protein L15 [Candidatus Omnitrophica bacterium]|nr:50S ribosomal protein L15 [Candidatus Omnitrophota bacterium]
MNISQLQPKKKHKKPKRVGRGPGSGHGKTSTRGHKGTGQRKGRMYYIGFGGGNVPYLRKIPKRGFTSKRPKEYQIVNLKDIVKKIKNKKEITPKELKKVNLIKEEKKPVKILADIEEEFSLDSVFKAQKFSKKAKEIIEKGGGKIEYLPE